MVSRSLLYWCRCIANYWMDLRVLVICCWCWCWCWGRVPSAGDFLLFLQHIEEWRSGGNQNYFAKAERSKQSRNGIKCADESEKKILLNIK